MAVICDVAASVAEVTANQPNQQGPIISLTYAPESWAALRASVAGTYISQALSPSLPVSFPSLKSQIIAGVTIFTYQGCLFTEDCRQWQGKGMFT